MPTEGGFTPDHPLSHFLSGHAEHEERGSLLQLLLLNASILFLVASLVAMAMILSWGNPAQVFADIKASLTDISALQPDTVQSTPIIQSTADAQAVPPTAKDAPPVNPGATAQSALPLNDKAALRPPTSGSPIATDAPTRNEIAAASEPAGQSRTENSEPPFEALFRQFQAWAAEEGTRAQVKSVQPIQDAPAQVVQDAPPPVRPMQKHRTARSVQNARAEIRHVQKPRAKGRREQNARVEVRPVQDAPAQDRSVQNAQAP